jgi:signal transduction histidine kinase
MNSIIGYTELLVDKVDGPLNREQEKSLKIVKDSANRLLRLIDDILSMSRIESAKARLEIKEIDIKGLIESIIPTFEPLIKQKGLTLTADMKEHLPHVYGDEDKIKQVLTNLLSNAVKFTPQGGVSIKAGPSEHGLKPGESTVFLEVCVEDTGIGIKEEDLKKIFGRFFQVDVTLIRRYEGAGIGLSAAKGIIDMHRGEIWATSEFGKGSRFCFTLPLRKEMVENPG